MAKLTKADILHVAKLARLDLSDAEVIKFLPQLSSVVDFIGQLNQVDIKDIEPTAQVTGLENVYRQDAVDSTNVLSQEAVLSGSEKIYNGYFKVGAILSERSDK
jgi:aspartyl-tRNA(Asn)/glutamyl-tRNA(Gln) amidotransferase subunit C